VATSIAASQRNHRKPGPPGAADIAGYARKCLRIWSDEDAWLNTPLPRMLRPEDELEGALALRQITRDSLSEALARSGDETETLRARRIYLQARLGEMPLTRAAHDNGITRRRLVLAQGKEDRILMAIFMRRFNVARSAMTAVGADDKPLLRRKVS